MNRNFNGPKDFKEFASHLSIELRNIGKIELSERFREYHETFFNSSSEFLGELRILLKEVIDQNDIKLPASLIKDIDKAIETINKAFGNRI